MRKVIILLDANILIADPFLSSQSWKSLQDRADEWNLEFKVPEVALAEAVNSVTASWKSDLQRLQATRSFLRTLELGGALDGLEAAVNSRINGYEDDLKRKLVEIGVEIIPVPADVDHLDIARRAIEGRAPYGPKGKDGYRDALIWFSVLGIAKSNDNCTVWLLSDNYSDFGSKSESKDTRDTSEYP
ncbi:PIN domain-containing protein, partial [Dietzia cinnamea]|uniref:PIN domain-containing protein n=1 Tax=Dietzia cinnamea TaxID=321318 RepID=UPI0021A2F011